MSLIQKLKKMNLPAETKVFLSYSEGTDVFVHNETEIETALEETDVVSTFSELLSTPKLRLYSNWGSEVLEDLRGEGLLDDYARDYTFPDYLCETINDNFYDTEVIDSSIEKYDHKRGFCTLSVDVYATLENILEASPFIAAWTVSVETENGTLTLS